MRNLTELLLSALYRGFTIRFEPCDIRKGYTRITVTYNDLNYVQIVPAYEFVDLDSILSIMIETLEYRSNEIDD